MYHQFLKLQNPLSNDTKLKLFPPGRSFDLCLSLKKHVEGSYKINETIQSNQTAELEHLPICLVDEEVEVICVHLALLEIDVRGCTSLELDIITSLPHGEINDLFSN